jgi:hypothetical protein
MKGFRLDPKMLLRSLFFNQIVRTVWDRQSVIRTYKLEPEQCCITHQLLCQIIDFSAWCECLKTVPIRLKINF